MLKKPKDYKTDIRTAEDRGEQASLMEPLLISQSSRHRGPLQDLAIDLAAKAAGFRRSLPLRTQTSVADMVLTMNCYYSNLIEGHDTHPISAERALSNDYSKDPKKRNLQLEALAHITVQKWIDEGNLKGAALQSSSLREIHKRFCDLLPPDMLWIEDKDKKERVPVVPGELRHRDVAVGGHAGISAGAVPRFLERFEAVFSRLGKSESILAAAAAHHRLLWIHPFIDGNGRVARLMSHAVFLDLLGTGGVWSIARGLARNVAAYKSHLANCDLPRRNDLDGRGNLSEEALAAFTRFFLEVCVDQVTFMESLMQPERLRARIHMWAEEEVRLGAIPAQARQVLEAVLYRGELPRGEIPALLGVGERQARRVVSTLIERHVLAADTQKSPVYLRFPAVLASRWMPGLFPEKTDSGT